MNCLELEAECSPTKIIRSAVEEVEYRDLMRIEAMAAQVLEEALRFEHEADKCKAEATRLHRRVTELAEGFAARPQLVRAVRSHEHQGWIAMRRLGPEEVWERVPGVLLRDQRD